MWACLAQEASPSQVYGAALLMRFGFTAHPGFKSPSLRSHQRFPRRHDLRGDRWFRIPGRCAHEARTRRSARTERAEDEQAIPTEASGPWVTASASRSGIGLPLDVGLVSWLAEGGRTSRGEIGWMRWVSTAARSPTTKLTKQHRTARRAAHMGRARRSDRRIELHPA